MDDDMKFELKALVTAGLVYAGVAWIGHLRRMRMIRRWNRVNRAAQEKRGTGQ